MGRPPKTAEETAVALREHIDSLPEMSKAMAKDAYKTLFVQRTDVPDLTWHWEKCVAVERLSGALGHTPQGERVCKLIIAALKAEKDVIQQWYEHERVERLDDLVTSLGQAIWNVLEPFIASEHHDEAREAFNAVTERLSRP